MNLSTGSKLGMRVVALGYLFFLLLVPIGVILWRTFERGIGAFIDAISTPANDFVMSFLGPVARLRGQLVRPHDVRVTREPSAGAVPATVGRVAHLGFEVRVELDPEGQEPVSAQTTREEAHRLGLRAGDRVYLHADHPPHLSLAESGAVG